MAEVPLLDPLVESGVFDVQRAIVSSQSTFLKLQALVTAKRNKQIMFPVIIAVKGATTFQWAKQLLQRAFPGKQSEGIFTVLKQQLGLKLVPEKGPREYLVIDSVQRPSEN